MPIWLRRCSTLRTVRNPTSVLPMPTLVWGANFPFLIDYRQLGPIDPIYDVVSLRFSRFPADLN